MKAKRPPLGDLWRSARTGSAPFGYLLVGPLVLWLVITIVAPLAYSVYLGFTDAGIIGTGAPFIGLENYATVFGDPDERKRLFAMIGSVTPEAMATDASALFDYLAARPDVRGERFGTTGYCMGGRTSITVAGRVPDRVAAAMSFHGGGLVTDDADSPHRWADRIQARVYVAGAAEDQSFTADDAETLDKALTAAGVEHTIEFYDAAHGFAVPDNGPFDEAAAERHWRAMESVFGAALR